MELGPFSISLAVADLAASRAFYERLGLSPLDGDGETWLLMASGTTKIGLFQGLFDRNTLTFNPPDVRAVQRQLEVAGASFALAAEEGTGPAHAVLVDPDGNPVLLDQTG